MAKSFPGGKAQAGTFQTIINLIPRHSTYIETCLGGGAIARTKRAAERNFLIDIDSQVIEAAANIFVNGDGRARYELICTDARTWLGVYPFQGSEFVYCDPPYVRRSRRQHRRIYRYEMSDEDHVELLDCLKLLPCPVMISGYWSELYGEMLAGWHTVNFQAVTRSGGAATEWLWMNYPRPVKLHEYTYLGGTFRERERIKRKKARWRSRLERMPILERQAILSAIEELE